MSGGADSGQRQGHGKVAGLQQRLQCVKPVLTVDLHEDDDAGVDLTGCGHHLDDFDELLRRDLRAEVDGVGRRHGGRDAIGDGLLKGR